MQTLPSTPPGSSSLDTYIPLAYRRALRVLGMASDFVRPSTVGSWPSKRTYSVFLSLLDDYYGLQLTHRELLAKDEPQRVRLWDDVAAPSLRRLPEYRNQLVAPVLGRHRYALAMAALLRVPEGRQEVLAKSRNAGVSSPRLAVHLLGPS